MTEPRELPEIPLNGMVVRPGDSLILHSPERLSDADVDRIVTMLREQLPGIDQVVILEGLSAVGVYRPEPEPIRFPAVPP